MTSPPSRTPEVRSRQIVVARLDDEVTVKRYRQTGSVVELLPENEDFDTIRVDLAEQAMVIEGGAALAVAGALKQKRTLAGRRVVLIISGSRIDDDVLRGILA